MKRFLLLATITASMFAAENANPTTQSNDLKQQPQVLEFEKVLKTAQEKKNNDNLPIPPLDKTETIAGDFNVVGTVTIANNKYCYLLLDSNKIVKATTGMTIKNKKIDEISEFGVSVSDKSKNTTYLPIMTSQVVESDIVFGNRDKNNNLKQ